MATTDFLSYTGTTTALLANGGYATGVSGLTATSSSGVLTFSDTGETLATEITAASNILAATHVAGTVDAFVNGGNTFVVEYNTSISPIVVELVDVAAGQMAITGTTVRPAALTHEVNDDFNGDGSADILWRNSDGDTNLWNSNGSGGFAHTDLGIVPTTWQIAGIGDFNGDGNADILWRNSDGDTNLSGLEWFGRVRPHRSRDRAYDLANRGGRRLQ